MVASLDSKLSRAQIIFMLTDKQRQDLREAFRKMDEAAARNERFRTRYDYDIKIDRWSEPPSKVETQKGRKVVNLLYASAEDIEFVDLNFIKWYQVYPKDKPSFGFAVYNNAIYDHPDKRKIGNHFQPDLSLYIDSGVEIVKVSEQIKL